MSCDMWFGTQDYAQFIRTPQTGADVSPQAWGSSGTLLNGGGYAMNSFNSHKEYQFSWGSTAAREAAQTMKSYFDGSFGRGKLYFQDPLTYTTNVLSARWADPSITANFEGPQLVPGVDPTTSPTSNFTVNSLPVRTAVFDMTNVAPAVGSTFNVLKKNLAITPVVSPATPGLSSVNTNNYVVIKGANPTTYGASVPTGITQVAHASRNPSSSATPNWMFSIRDLDGTPNPSTPARGFGFWVWVSVPGIQVRALSSGAWTAVPDNTWFWYTSPSPIPAGDSAYAMASTVDGTPVPSGAFGLVCGMTAFETDTPTEPLWGGMNPPVPGTTVKWAGAEFASESELGEYLPSGNPALNEDNSVFIPIPDGMQLNVGAFYSSDPGSGVYMTSSTQGGGVGSVTRVLSPLSSSSNSLFPDVFTKSPGDIGVNLWIGKSTPGSQSVRVSAIHARLSPIGQTPGGENRWIGGQGNAGVRFTQPPTYINHTGVNGGQIEFAATFKESIF